MKLVVELDREEDGRWIADVVTLPGVMVYGATREEALTKVKALALWRIADMLEHGEMTLDDSILFEEAQAAA